MSVIYEKVNVCADAVYKSVYLSYFKLLRNFLVFKFGNVQRAEDTAQNAFVILWENCQSVTVEKAKSYLFTTAIRQALNQLKHDKVVLRFENQFQQSEIHLESPEFLVLEQEFQTKLELAIQNLPEKQRLVFLMNRIENQSYNEIAAMLEISVKAVEKRMHQALLVLRKEIGNI
jgi:RNA polymerase sigma factor (sigma-70 family)